MVYLISITAAIVIFCAIYAMGMNRAIERDMVNKRLGMVQRVSRKQYSATEEELSLPLSERILKPILVWGSGLVARLSHRAIGGEGGDPSKRLQWMRTQLNMAGVSMDAAEFIALRILVILGIGLLTLFIVIFGGTDLGSYGLLTMLAGFLAPYAGFRFFLTSRISKRRLAMEQQLPDVLDLLSVSVEAGLGFEQALVHITNNMDGPLIDELAVTAREMALGRTRRDALTLLGQRCDVEELRSFVSALVQAGQLGISMKNVLRTQAAAMRLARKNKVQERAMKVSTKMLLPMVVFIFPVIFIVLMGPAFINLMTLF